MAEKSSINENSMQMEFLLVLCDVPVTFEKE
jgi:hypothetical protein